MNALKMFGPRPAYIAAVVMSLAMLQGCAGNPFTRFYENQKYQPDPKRIITFSGTPRLEQVSVDDIEKNVLSMADRGFTPIGKSDFTSGKLSSREVESYALAQAKILKAEIVVLVSIFDETVTGTHTYWIPETHTNPISGTVYSSGVGGGSYTFTGTATTTSTTVIQKPYSIDRYRYRASYWVRIKRRGIGLVFRELTIEERQKTGTNRALSVYWVLKDSSAYNADILPGDVVVSIDGINFSDVSEANAYLLETEGDNVTVKIDRKGQLIKKRIRNRLLN